MASQPKDQLERALTMGEFDNVLKMFSRNANDAETAQLRTQIKDFFVKESSVVDNLYSDAKIIAEFTSDFKKMNEKQKLRFVISDGRSPVIEQFIQEFLPALSQENVINFLKGCYKDELAKMIWERKNIDKWPKKLMLDYFKCVTEQFSVWLLTTQNVGGTYPQEVLLILVSKLQNANSALRDEVLKYIFENTDKCENPEQLFNIMPYCPRNEMKRVCKRLQHITTQKALVNSSQSVLGYLGDPSQVEPIQSGSEKFKSQGALIIMPLTDEKRRIYSLRIGVHDTQKCDPHPITLCLLQPMKEYANIYLEDNRAGVDRTKCIGCLNEKNPLYKLPYPLPYLGRYGHFKLIVSIDANAEKIEPVPALLQNKSVMILNPYHQGRVPTRLQFTDVPVNETTTFGNLLSQVNLMLNPGGNQINAGFLNNNQPQYAIAYRDGRICPPDTLVLEFPPPGAQHVFLLIDAKQLSNGKQPAQNQAIFGAPAPKFI